MHARATLILALWLALPAAGAESPHASRSQAPIKALTDDEQAGLREGQGMGFAKAAELNGYPGPRHVLELAAELGLTDEQVRASTRLFERMRATAAREGSQLIEAERALDALFATRAATEGAVHELLSRIEALRTRIRGTHLDAHLEQAALLTPQQVARYSQLRGYTESGHHGHHPAAH